MRSPVTHPMQPVTPSNAKSLADVLGVQDPQAPDNVVQVSAKNFRMTARAFCKEILDSRQYRESLLRRIITDSLPPAVEQLLYYYANGKPVERVEVKETTTDFSSLSPAQIEARLLHLAQIARRMQTPKTNDVAVPATDDALSEPATPSIH